MTDVVHAEWTKLRTLPGTGWLLLAAAALTAAVGAIATNAVTCPAGTCQLDPARVSLTGIDLGQVMAADRGRDRGQRRVQHRDDPPYAGRHPPPRPGPDR